MEEGQLRGYKQQRVGDLLMYMHQYAAMVPMQEV